MICFSWMVKTQANSSKMMRLIFIDATFVPHRNPLCTIDLQNTNIFLIIHMSINSLSSITNRFSPNISTYIETLPNICCFQLHGRRCGIRIEKLFTSLDIKRKSEVPRTLFCVEDLKINKNGHQ